MGRGNRLIVFMVAGKIVWMWIGLHGRASSFSWEARSRRAFFARLNRTYGVVGDRSCCHVMVVVVVVSVFVVAVVVVVVVVVGVVLDLS